MSYLYRNKESTAASHESDAMGKTKTELFHDETIGYSIYLLFAGLVRALVVEVVFDSLLSGSTFLGAKFPELKKLINAVCQLEDDSHTNVHCRIFSESKMAEVEPILFYE